MLSRFQKHRSINLFLVLPKRFFAVEAPRFRGNHLKEKVIHDNQEPTIGDFLKQLAQDYEHRDCFRSVQEKVRLTYSEFLEKQVIQSATGLFYYGWCFRVGQNVGYALPFSHLLVQTYLGASHLGIVSQFLEPRISATELGYYFGAKTPIGLITAVRLGNDDRIAMLRELLPDLKRYNFYTEAPLRFPQYPSIKFLISTALKREPGFVPLPSIACGQGITPSPLLKITPLLNGDQTISGYVAVNPNGEVTVESRSHTLEMQLGRRLAQVLGLTTDDRVGFASMKAPALPFIGPLIFGTLSIGGTLVSMFPKVEIGLAEDHVTVLVATPDILQKVFESNVPKDLRTVLFIDDGSEHSAATLELVSQKIPTFVAVSSREIRTPEGNTIGL